MVRISEEDVFEAFSNEWRRVDEVYREIGRRKGVLGLSIYEKLKYLATFQYPYVNKIAFNIHITNLRESGVLEMRRANEDVEVMKSEIRRNPTPKRQEIPSEEIYIPFNPFWFS